MEKHSLETIRLQLNFSKRISAVFLPLAFDAALGGMIYYCLRRGDVIGGVVVAALVPVLSFNAFSLMHEGVHHNLSERAWVNQWIGVVGGAFCFLPYEPWREMHMAHHLWAGNITRDPVNKLRKDYDPQKAAKNAILSTIWRSWLPLLALLQHIVFWLYPLQILKSKKVPETKRAVFAASYVVPAALYVALYLASPPVWPLALGVFFYLVLVEFVNLPHHLELPTYSGDTRLKLLDQYLIARSGIYPRWFSRWVLLNFNLHLEHHLFPNLPWHELEKARKLVKPVLGEEYNETQGSQWLREHRSVPLGDLLAPRDNKAEEKKAA